MTFAQLTVSGGNISAVSTPSGVPLAEALRAQAGLGTMAQQNASAVAITGGTAVLTRMGLGGYGTDPAYSLNLQGQTTLNGVTGIGGVPNAAQGILSVYGNLWTNGTIVGGNSTLALLGVGGYSPDPLHPLNVQGNSVLNGNVGMGVAPIGAARLNVSGQCYISGNTGIARPAGGSFSYNFEVGGTAAMNGGGPWANLTSMRVLKQNIRNLEGGLRTLLRLRPRQWEWATDRPDLEAQMPGTQTGFVVEELAEDLPSWVKQGPEGLTSYREQGTTALLVDALRELTRRLEALEARLAG